MLQNIPHSLRTISLSLQWIIAIGVYHWLAVIMLMISSLQVSAICPALLVWRRICRITLRRSIHWATWWTTYQAAVGRVAWECPAVVWAEVWEEVWADQWEEEAWAVVISTRVWAATWEEEAWVSSLSSISPIIWSETDCWMMLSGSFWCWLVTIVMPVFFCRRWP